MAKTGRIIQQHLIWNDSNGVRQEAFIGLPEWETDEENATEIANKIAEIKSAKYPIAVGMPSEE